MHSYYIELNDPSLALFVDYGGRFASGIRFGIVTLRFIPKKSYKRFASLSKLFEITIDLIDTACTMLPIKLKIKKIHEDRHYTTENENFEFPIRGHTRGAAIDTRHSERKAVVLHSMKAMEIRVLALVKLLINGEKGILKHRYSIEDLQKILPF